MFLGDLVGDHHDVKGVDIYQNDDNPFLKDVLVFQDTIMESLRSFSHDIARQKLKKGIAAFQNENFGDAYKILDEALSTLPIILPLQETYQLKHQILYWHAKCACKLDRHSMRNDKQTVRDIFCQNFISTMSFVNVDDRILETVSDYVDCLTLHNDTHEAFRQTKNFIRKMPRVDLLIVQSVNLLIHHRKLKKALKVIESRCYHGQDWQRILALFFMKDYSQADSLIIQVLKNHNNGIMPMNAEDAIQILSNVWKPIKPCMFDIITGCLRKTAYLESSGCPMLALKYFRSIRNAFSPTTMISYAICKSECGNPYNIVQLMDDALSKPQLLQDITQGCLENALISDAKRFLRQVRKDLRSPNGSEKLKNNQIELQSYNNSLHIGLYFRRFLKETVPLWICSIQPNAIDK